MPLEDVQDPGSKNPSKQKSKSRGSLIILRKMGMEHSLAFRLRDQSRTNLLGASALRAPADIESWETPAHRIGGAQKSGMTLTKSSNWGPMRGLISADPYFTKIEIDKKTGAKKTIGLSSIDIEKTPHYLETGDLTKVPATESLRSILNRTGPSRDYTITGFDPHTRTLKFVCNDDKKPDDAQVEFSLILKKGPDYEKRFTKSQEASSRRFEFAVSSYQYPAPQFLKDIETEDTQFKIADFLDVELDCFAQKLELDSNGERHYTETPQIIEVFADKNGNPYTGDWDQLLTAHSNKFPDWMRYPINTFHSDHRLENIQKLKEWSSLAFGWLDKNGFIDPTIKANMKKDKIGFTHLISDFLLGRAGSITPFEFVKNSLQNYLENGLTPDSLKSLQHGCENRNPYDPSNLDGNMLHFIDAEIIKTSNEQEIIDLYLNRPGFLENNNIDVHPKWNIVKWGVIIEKQLQIAEAKLQNGEMDKIYLPPPEILENYNNFLIQNGKEPILDRVSHILVAPDFFKYNNFYDLNPSLFMGVDAEQRFYTAVKNQLQHIESRKNFDPPKPYHVIKPECMQLYNEIAKRMKEELEKKPLVETTKISRKKPKTRTRRLRAKSVRSRYPYQSFSAQKEPLVFSTALHQEKRKLPALKATTITDSKDDLGGFLKPPLGTTKQPKT